MSLVAILEALEKAGCSSEQIIAAAKAHEASEATARAASLAEDERRLEERRAARREGNAARQRKWRNAHNAVTDVNNALCGVTTRDTPALDKEIPPTPPKEIKPSPEFIRSETRARADAFVEFWDKWPNKVAKPEAMRAFGKVRSELPEILSGIARYVANKPDDRAWMHPATFLNQRRWEDEYDSPPARAGPHHRPINGHSRQQTNIQLDIIAQEIYDERQRRSGS